MCHWLSEATRSKRPQSNFVVQQVLPSCLEIVLLIEVWLGYWYNLPCRIYGAPNEYNCHFTLFAVYVHFDVARKKTVLFYIHRLGSEHPSAAEVSSRKVKDRVREALQYAAKDHHHIQALKACPFLIQLPTIACSIVFWTETLHKEKLNMWAKEDEAKKNIASTDTSNLHNIARYLHSYLDNTETLCRSLAFVKEEHIWFASSGLALTSNSKISSWSETFNDTLDSQIFQIETILTWAKGVLKRNQILLDLVISLTVNC